MQLVINDINVEYVPDYPDGWQFSAGDPFKFPVLINDQLCFIKRFEAKSPEDISGWQLLQKLKGLKEPNLPRVFDIQPANEDGNEIAYVFYEYIEGQPLEKMVYQHEAIHLKRLTSDLINAMDALHRYGFWFADFTEKNIFCEKSGRYLLVDLDSAQPLSLSPSNDMFGSKDYWAPVYQFYRDVLKQHGIRLSDIGGLELNYLQLFFLVLHLKLFKESGRKIYRSDEETKALPQYLNSRDTTFQHIFSAMLNSHGAQLPIEKIQQIKTLIETKIITSAMSTTSISANAAIQEFTSSRNRVVGGEPFILSWKAEGDKLELYRNGALLKTIDSAQQNMERTEFYDSTTDVVYELVAYKNGAQVKAGPVIIKYGTTDMIPDKKLLTNLVGAAPWTRFLGVGALVLSVLVAIVCVITYKDIVDSFSVVVWSILLIFFLSLIFPGILLIRYANKISKGVETGNITMTQDALLDMKRFFTVLGYIFIGWLVGLVALLGYIAAH